jgi:hypothetical protein
MGSTYPFVKVLYPDQIDDTTLYQCFVSYVVACSMLASSAIFSNQAEIVDDVCVLGYVDTIGLAVRCVVMSACVLILLCVRNVVVPFREKEWM